jgi:hypothetical protein
MGRVARSLSTAGVAMLFALALVVGPAAFAGTGAARDARQPRRCNGSAELCRRRLDQTSFPVAHNAMASEAAGFADPYQASSIPQQLEAGVRGLMLDVYTGTPSGARVCTDPTPLKVAEIERTSGKEEVDRLLAIRNATCPPTGGPTAGTYLCHSFCELGAAKLVDELRGIGEFLDAHPDDVLVLMLEDYAPVGDIEAAFVASGLDERIARHRSGARWPTLGKLLGSGRQLVVFLQHQGDRKAGLLPQYEEMNETPYDFASTQEFTCAANRGPATASLFLVNHWIDRPDREVAAAEANTAAVLGARVRQCAAERRHRANFVAVNFAEVGDVVTVVDELNGVSR